MMVITDIKVCFLFAFKYLSPRNNSKNIVLSAPPPPVGMKTSPVGIYGKGCTLKAGHFYGD
jgi:hypothetical protein